MKRFVIVGLGSFGAAAAEALAELGHDVSALDLDEEAVEDIAPKVTQAAVGDGANRGVLERLGATDADAAVVSTGNDVAASVLATMALKDCGISAVHVKVVSQAHRRVMEKIGVAGTVFPERDSAQRMAKRISSRQVVNFVELGPGFSMQEMAIPKRWVGQSLRELALPQRYRVAVIAIHDYLMDTYQTIPKPDAPLKDSDTLLLAGEDDRLEALAELP